MKYLAGKHITSSYEPNRLMSPIGLWRWYIKAIITILDIIHRPVFYLKAERFEGWIVSAFRRNLLSWAP
jgi:hypothetical protein